MKFGLFGINIGACAMPETAAAIARAAEAAGFDSVWTGEHVVLPDPRQPPSPLPPETPIIDPAIALTFIAANTKSIRLGTGIIILPQRNPLVLAKQLASVDVLSGGRLIFGIGIGYLKAEFDALGVPFTDKAARSEDFLAAMLAIWTQEKPAYRGRFVSFGGVQAMPRPVQKPHPEIVFGGNSPQGCERAVRLAKGWYGFALDFDATNRCIEALRKACADRGRRFDELEISVTPFLGRGAGRSTATPPSRDAAKRFADLGVHRLILNPPAKADQAELLNYVAQAERDLIGKV
jgi:probable F420-dependent oxidoreductase